MLWQATGAPLPSRAGDTYAALIRSRSPPCPPVAGVTHAALARGRFFLPTGGPRRRGAQLEPPTHWGAGVACFALARPEPPLPTGGPGLRTLPWRPAGVPPAHRGPRSRTPLWRAAGAPLLKKQFSSNINQNCIWLMFDIKRQPKLYLVDV